MCSKTTRIFSQGAELSQLENLSNSKNESNNNAQQKQTHNYSQEYNTVPIYHQEVSEDHLSSRADVICEENRQITNFVQSSLKQLEKRRINLINKKLKIEEETKCNSEIHERQRHESFNAQMSLEEWAGKYKNELDQRPTLLEKQNHAQVLVGLVENHHANGLAVGEEVQRAQQNLHSEMENRYKQLETNNLKSNQMKTLFKEVMQQNIIKAQEYTGMIMKEREDNINDIQNLALQNDEVMNKITHLQQELSHCLKNKEELNNVFNTISLQNKTLFEDVTDLHRSLDKCRAAGASDIQDLKLQINTEQNNNSNLGEKCNEKENYFNSLSTKQKELVNLTNQLKMAIENALKDNEEQLVKIEECKIKKTSISEETKYFTEGIQQFSNVEEENHSFKKILLTLEEDIQLCNVVLKEKEDTVKHLNDQVEESKKILFCLEEKISRFDSELEKCKIVNDELISKEKEENIKYQQKREDMMSQCSNIEKENVELARQAYGLEMSIEELKVFKKTLETKAEEIDSLIKKYKQDAEESKEKLFVAKEENEEHAKSLKEEIDDKYNRLETYEESLIEAKPKQDELILIKSKKDSLEQDSRNQNEQFMKEKESFANKFNSKALELNRETDNYTSVMKKIINGEEVATEKLTVEIQEIEKTKTKLEDELKTLYKQFTVLKNEEANKRDRVAKMEKRLQTINKEIKVTKQDLSDITGTNQIPTIIHNSNKSTTPTSSLGSLKNQNLAQNQNQPTLKKMAYPNKGLELKPKVVNQAPPAAHHSSKRTTPMPYMGSFKTQNYAQNQPPLKKMAYSKGLELLPNVVKQVSTKKWVESVPDDEYEFSEI